MKTLVIHTNPQYWGDVTENEARRLAAKMCFIASDAGFKTGGDRMKGTDEEAATFFMRNSGDYEEINWFDRWCSHGFKGMVGWLREQCRLNH